MQPPKGEPAGHAMEPVGKAALDKGVSEDLFDKVVIPINLTRPGTADDPADSGKA